MSNKFAKNLKYIRESKGISKNKLGEMVGVNQTTIGRWETEEIKPSIDNVEEVAKVLNVPLPDLLIKDLNFDNAEVIDMDSDIVMIPVYGTIKAGIPLESQTDIIEYMRIPKEWTNGDKKLFGLRLSGDSMFPKYQDGETVIFEQTGDLETYKNKDCAVMINHTESTFKKVLVNDKGIVLQPYNTAYDIMMFSNDEINTLPIAILGVARKKVSDIE